MRSSSRLEYAPSAPQRRSRDEVEFNVKRTARKSYSQSAESVESNATFFLEKRVEYARNVGALDPYLAIHDAVSSEVRGIDHLLDIGNGGVFDYDTACVKRITGIDLFLDKVSDAANLPDNVTMQVGDALDLPKPDSSFDGVLLVMLLHH